MHSNNLQCEACYQVQRVGAIKTEHCTHTEYFVSCRKTRQRQAQYGKCSKTTHSALQAPTGKTLAFQALDSFLKAMWYDAAHVVDLLSIIQILTSHFGVQIFSISNNSVLFKQAYPNCWSKFRDCNEVRF